MQEVGPQKTSTLLYHKNHIDKVMCMAITAFAFYGTPEMEVLEGKLDSIVARRLGLRRNGSERAEKTRKAELDTTAPTYATKARLTWWIVM